MSGKKDIRLLVTSGDGPGECRRAVSLILRQMEREAVREKLVLHATSSSAAGALGKGETRDPASALVRVSGDTAEDFARRWTGTVKWIAQSPFRPHHKRRNWFAGIFRLEAADDGNAALDPKDLKYETFRAGGPGGQHQNTTDSAVRLTHLPSGTSVIARDERSQHRNKKAALDRLADRLFLDQQAAAARSKSAENILHKRLERGNAVRCFKGEEFQEVVKAK
jgi:peptide chain release factor